MEREIATTGLEVRASPSEFGPSLGRVRPSPRVACRFHGFDQFNEWHAESVAITRPNNRLVKTRESLMSGASLVYKFITLLLQLASFDIACLLL